MNSLVDTHVHLTDPQFSDPSIIIENARAAGVCQMIAVATDAQSSKESVKLAECFPEVFAAVGIHPNSCHQATAEDWHIIEELSQHSRVVALGETGLDLYRNYAPFDLQDRYFRRHLELARQRNLPVIIHMRDCQEELLRVLESESRSSAVSGVMHSFSGSYETATKCLEHGLYISFSGMLTYKKSEQLRCVAAQIPLDRLLVETDAPYLSPEPHRGRRPNEPALLIHTVRRLAETLHLDYDQVAQCTTRNARRLFNLPS